MHQNETNLTQLPSLNYYLEMHILNTCTNTYMFKQACVHVYPCVYNYIMYTY